MKKLSRRRVLQGALALGALGASGCATSSAGSTGVAGSAAAMPEKTVSPKSILILGGTGFLGPHVVELARARGHKLTLFHRGKTRPNLFPEVEKLLGDRDGNLKALEGRTWDAVVDTSGYVPRIVRASAQLLAPHVGHYVFISTISVYKELPRPGMDETTPVATVEDETTEDVSKYYGALKALCERAAEESSPGRVTNIRPGLIVGSDDPTQRFTYWPERVARGGEVLAPGTGEDPAQFIDARDLAEFILTCIERQHMGTFNAVGNPMPMRTLLETCRQVSGSEATFTWADAAFLEQQGVKPWSDMPVWVPGTGEEAGFAQVSNARAVERGLHSRPLEDTVRATLEWWRSLPEERKAQLAKRAGLPPERERQVLEAWHRSQAAKAG
jgi:2'-hydroxyisoflavone reductase